jgi:peptide/nickel transport system ATP-binding protein
MSTLLEISNLQVHFSTPAGTVKANNGVNLEVAAGEAAGIMGESGCGKTVLFLSILRLQEPGKIVSGSIRFNGMDIVQAPEKAMCRIRGHQIGFIPQNQATALNPSYTVEQHLGEILNLRERGPGLWQNIFSGGKLRRAHRAGVEKLLAKLGLGDHGQTGKLMKSYPHQLSGGMRQRILTAMALLQNPVLLIADEPTTALDRATRNLSLKILQEVKQQTTLLLVSHDIETITAICDTVAVMYCGRIIERGPAAEILERPLHPYTRLLVSCRKVSREIPLPELFIDSQDLIHLPFCCAFQSFCPQAKPVCFRVSPGEYHSGNRAVSCHQYDREVIPC